MATDETKAMNISPGSLASTASPPKNCSPLTSSVACALRGRKRRLSLMQAAATSPKKQKVSEEELDKMEESINRQRQLDGEMDSDSHRATASSSSSGTHCSEPPAMHPLFALGDSNYWIFWVLLIYKMYKCDLAVCNASRFSVS